MRLTWRQIIEQPAGLVARLAQVLVRRLIRLTARPLGLVEPPSMLPMLS
jgi:hypothetical protein